MSYSDEQKSHLANLDAVLESPGFRCRRNHPGWRCAIHAAVALILVIASYEIAVAQAKSIGELRQMFDYDPRLPLDLKEIGVENKTGVRINDISYQSPKGGRVTAYLVVPSDNRRKFAGVIFMHPRPGSRNNFLDEAVSLARVGAVSLLIDAPFSRAGESKRDFDSTVTKPLVDRDIYIQTVVDLRRGVDLLLARSDIDPKRIAFVGHSYGAHTGAVLAGVEKRLKAYVIMAGAPSLTEFLRTSSLLPIVKVRDSLTKEQQDNYFSTLADVDPIAYIGDVKPATLFFQFGKTDGYPTEEKAKLYSEKASNPKLVKFYDAGHALNDEAKRERAAWLRDQIGIGKLN
jgi:dienelactone hydrolase